MFADDTNIGIPSRTLADLQPLINFELAIILIAGWELISLALV